MALRPIRSLCRHWGEKGSWKTSETKLPKPSVSFIVELSRIALIKVTHVPEHESAVCLPLWAEETLGESRGETVAAPTESTGSQLTGSQLDRWYLCKHLRHRCFGTRLAKASNKKKTHKRTTTKATTDMNTIMIDRTRSRRTLGVLYVCRLSYPIRCLGSRG